MLGFAAIAEVALAEIPLQGLGIVVAPQRQAAFKLGSPVNAYSVFLSGLTNAAIAIGGTAIVAVPPSPRGGFITNPATATEPLYVDAVNLAQLVARGTTFRLEPGQTWTIIPGQTTATTVNAATAGHQFLVISW